jgi:hypothetical protein
MDKQPPISGATLLRKLTEKSILKFGRYHDIPIFKLLETFQGREYLIWVYYNCSGITFIDEILDKLHRRPEERLEKPGKNEKLWTRHKRKMEKWKIGTQGVKAISKKRKSQKHSLKRKQKSNHLTKGRLMSINHGQ